MHKSEKSDAVVVAVKPANKAERSAAEPVEPRTATKGNAGQQSTRRAQDRESVSRALERVRQAARQRKKERFTALLHHIGPAMLRTAFYATKRDAAPGGECRPRLALRRPKGCLTLPFGRMCYPRS